MSKTRCKKSINNNRYWNTKWLLLQNDKNADTTFLHSHDGLLPGLGGIMQFLHDQNYDTMFDDEIGGWRYFCKWMVKLKIGVYHQI